LIKCSAKATRGFAELLGLDQTWSRTGKEILPNEDECKYTNNGKITLLPKDENTGSLGGEFVCTWNYKAPSLSVGDIKFRPLARFFYNYSTTTIASVTLVPKEEMKSYIQSGGSLKSDIISQSKSPIMILLKPKSPINVYQGGSYEFPVEIDIDNTGGGTACVEIGKCRKSGRSSFVWNEIKIKLLLPEGIKNVNCPDNKVIHIPKGSSQKIGCRLRIDTDVNTATQKFITVYSDYGYFIDKAIDITISSGMR